MRTPRGGAVWAVRSHCPPLLHPTPTLYLLQDKVKALFGRYEVIVHNWRNIMGHALVLEFTPAAALVKVWKGRVWGGVGRDGPEAERVCLHSVPPSP